jgi:hypothetical protein
MSFSVDQKKLMKYAKIGVATSIVAQPFEVLRTSMILTKTSTTNINIKGIGYI